MSSRFILVFLLLFFLSGNTLFAHGDGKFRFRLVNEVSSEERELPALVGRAFQHVSNLWVLRANVLPGEWKKYVNRAAIKLERNEEMVRIKQGEDTVQRERYDHYSASFNTKKKVGSFTFLGRLTYHDYQNEIPSGEKHLLTHRVGVRYRSGVTVDLDPTDAGTFDRWGYETGIEHETDQVFLLSLGDALHDVERWRGRISVSVSMIEVESLYEDQQVDNDQHYYRSESAMALRFPRDGWQLVAGQRYIKENLNRREINAAFLTFRGATQGDKEGAEWSLTLLLDENDFDSWQFLATLEDERVGVEVLVERLSGLLGDEDAYSANIFVNF